MSNVVKFQPKKKDNFGKLVVAAAAVAFLGSAGAYHLLPQTALSEAAAAVTRPLTSYSLCSGSIRIHCVVDGDTIWSAGEKIRIADIDTPEVSEPGCASELALGKRATARLLELVNAGPFEMHAWQGRDEDQYGRKLRVLVRNGRSLGDVLVSEGLARTWTGRRQPWC